MNFDLYDHIMGITLLESEFFTIPKKQIVNRSWRERLLSWPWRPWITEKEIEIRVPDTNLYRMNSHTFVGHPATVAQIKNKLDE